MGSPIKYYIVAGPLRRRLASGAKGEAKLFEKNRNVWDNPTMTVTADAKKRVILPTAKPGDRFDVQSVGEGKVIFTKLEPVAGKPASVKLEKHGGFTVGVLSRPIDEQALKEALAEFP